MLYEPWHLIFPRCDRDEIQRKMVKDEASKEWKIGSKHLKITLLRLRSPAENPSRHPFRDQQKGLHKSKLSKIIYNSDIQFLIHHMRRTRPKISAINPGASLLAMARLMDSERSCSTPCS